jgi:hypothetical protein
MCLSFWFPLCIVSWIWHLFWTLSVLLFLCPLYVGPPMCTSFWSCSLYRVAGKQWWITFHPHCAVQVLLGRNHKHSVMVTVINCAFIITKNFWTGLLSCAWCVCWCVPGYLWIPGDYIFRFKSLALFTVPCNQVWQIVLPRTSFLFHIVSQAHGLHLLIHIVS